MSDKDNTFIFKPEEPERAVEKEKIARTDVDEFTIARKTREEPEEEKSYALPIIASVLGTLLVIAIVALVIFLTSGGEEETPAIPKEPAKKTEEIVIKEDSEEEEEETVVKEYTLGYNNGKIYETEDGGYSVVFEMYDGGEKTGEKKFYINKDTDIRDNDKKIGLEYFMNFIESQAGEIIIFDCEVNEEEILILKMKYSSSGYGEEEETASEEEDTPEKEESESEKSEEDVSEIPADEEPPVSDIPADTETSEE